MGLTTLLRHQITISGRPQSGNFGHELSREVFIALFIRDFFHLNSGIGVKLQRIGSNASPTPE